MLDNKTILITGGTGSFGKAYTKFLLENYDVKKIIIFSRDEQKHYRMIKEFDHTDKLVFKIGDIRNKDRMLEVTKGIDFLMHTAAMKHVPMAEANPYEAVRSNIIGVQNIITACKRNGVKKVVALSTDKAALPINTYGATKFLLERLFIAANQDSDAVFSVVRYANVFGSKGSVIPLFLRFKKLGKDLTITDPEMTRFSITMQESIDLAHFALLNGIGGEIVVPLAPSYKLKSIADAICKNCNKKIIGARLAEKMHETMISSYETPFTLKLDKYYVITPEKGKFELSDYEKHYAVKDKCELKEYSSNLNTNWLSVQDIQELLQKEELID